MGSRCIAYHTTELEKRQIQSQPTLPNPEYSELVKLLAMAERRGDSKKAQRVQYSMGKTPEVLHYWKQDADGALLLPIGFVYRLPGGSTMMKASSDGCDAVIDRRLRMYQWAAMQELLGRRGGVLNVPTGGGKTFIGCAMIAARKSTALVIVPTKELQGQWDEEIQEILRFKPRLLGGKARAGDDRATIAIINSAAKHVAKYSNVGHLIVDECHRVASKMYWDTVMAVHAAYRLGLSATPYRRDGLGPVIEWAFGPTTALSRSGLVKSGHLLKIDYRQVASGFETELDGAENFTGIRNELVYDPGRNALIKALAEGEQGITLVLVDRVAHCDILGKQIDGSVIINGKLKPVERWAALADAKSLTRGTIIATSDLLGEGFDLPAASTLILASPTRFSGRIIQRIGRVLRPYGDQTHGAVIDICDWKVPQLAGQAAARRRVYEKIKLEEKEG